MTDRRRRRRRYTVGKKKRLPTWLYFALIALFAAVAVYSAWQLIGESIRSSQTKREEAQIQETIAKSLNLEAENQTPEPTEVVLPAQTATPKPTTDPSLLRDALLANKDTIGALIAGSYIKSYVVQRDNAYYLTHGFYGEENRAGCIFADELCSVAADSRHILLHGHNMNDGTIFGKLKEYRHDYYVNLFPTIRFVTPYEDATYVIFSVAEIDTNPDDGDYFGVARFHFADDADFLTFAQTLKKRSLFEIPVDVNETDALLTLMTCYSQKKTARIAVIARKLREGETAAQFDNMFPTAERDLYYKAGFTMMTGADVVKVQRALVVLGYFKEPCDGVYGLDTSEAVKKFQRDNGLTADGAIGAQTRALLTRLAEQKESSGSSL